jgi:hypothetical protein
MGADEEESRSPLVRAMAASERLRLWLSGAAVAQILRVPHTQFATGSMGLMLALVLTPVCTPLRHLHGASSTLGLRQPHLLLRWPLLLQMISVE